MRSLTDLIKSALLSAAIASGNITTIPQYSWAESPMAPNNEVGEAEESHEVNHDHTEEFYSNNYHQHNLGDLEEEVRYHPIFAGYIRLASLYSEKGAYEKQKATVGRLIREYPLFIPALEKEVGQHPTAQGFLMLSTLYSFVNEWGRWEKVQKAAEKSIELDPGNWRPYVNVAVSLMETLRYDSAWKFLDIAKQLSPNNPHICFHFGQIQKRRGLNHLAIYHFGEALKIDPHHEAAALQRNDLMMKLFQR